MPTMVAAMAGSTRLEGTDRPYPTQATSTTSKNSRWSAPDSTWKAPSRTWVAKVAQAEGKTDP